MAVAVTVAVSSALWYAHVLARPPTRDVFATAWTDSKNTSEVCRLYGNPSPKSPEISPPPAAVAAQIAALARAALGVGNLSVASYVQLTDTEMECDGIISMDRTPKFSDAQIAAIKMANDELVGGQPAACAPMTDSKEAMVVEAVPRWLWGV